MNFKRFGRTANLWDGTVFKNMMFKDGRYESPATTSSRNVIYIPVVGGETYTFSINSHETGTMFQSVCSIDEPNPDVSYAIDGQSTFINHGEVNTFTRTIPSTANWFAIQIMSLDNLNNNIMINAGSTALPYQPYKDWNDAPYYIHKTDTDTITTLPADIYANSTTATVELKGQMEQSGTPTPTTPIQPQECGEKTGNLWNNGDTWENNNTDTRTFFQPDIALFDGNTKVGDNVRIDVKSNGYKYLVSITPNTSFTRVSVKHNGSTRDLPLGSVYGEFEANVPVTISFIVNGFDPTTIGGISISNIMLNTGSTALPYEPYGYKLNISSANTTTPVYLGEVQTTRKIKKLVLTGTETVAGSAVTGGWIITNLSDSINNTTGLQTSYCSHYIAKNNGVMSSLSQGEMCISTRVNNRINFVTTFASAEDFKAYLATQYAAGTPVTIWYVLATEETGIVNEPLRKIGDYADEVSGITIPTIAGADSFDVLTTLKPSEVTVNYKGWHSVADVHVYPDSSWMPTSWEEFRKAVRSGKAQSLYPVGTKLYENWGDTTSDAWIVVDYPTGEDYLDSDLAQQGYTNRVMLMEEKLNYLRQFDAIEAWLYVETAIPAGTYRFTIPNYDTSYGGNKTYIFTSTANVPVGGQLTLTWAYQQNPSAVQAYSSATSTSALFNVSITEWDGTTACTDLGTIKLAQNDPDSTYGKLNHIHRARYGSNNYYQSGYRQWLNTNASANWWTPTNVFDRPYGNRTNAGRLNVMNSNMKSVLATPTVNCITNNLFEYPSLDGTTFSLQTVYTVTDKLFPVTHSEVNLSSSPNVNSVLDYYVGKGNADRIKYRKDNGNAYYWWLRTPYPTNAYIVRGVYTSGALHTSNASVPSGSAAACIIQ